MRKLTALILTGALTLGALAPTALADGDHHGNENRPKYEQEFKDWQSDHWANESLARMITRGVIQGNGDATIATNQPVTRLEAAIMLSRLLELPAPDMPSGDFKVKAPWGEIEVKNKKGDFEIKIKSPQGEFKLADGEEIPDWGRKAILIGLREGFLIFDGASLSPMKPLNRLEAAIMMVKAAGLDAQAQSRAGATLEFKDANQIPERLRGYIAIAVENGFVTGYDNGTYQADQILTRAEWAALLDRLDRRNGPPVSSDGRQIKATVTDVHVGSAPSLTVTTPVYPGGVTYGVDDTAVFYRDRKEVTIADIQADDQVIINLNSDRKILLVTVVNVARQVSGKVEAFVSPTQSVSGSLQLNENGTSRTYTVTNDARVLLGGKAVTFADVRQGDQVTLKLEGARVKEIAIKADSTTVNATLESVDFGSSSQLPTLKVKGANNVRTTYQVADHATVKAANGSAITLADLQAGDELTLKVERDLVTAIQVKSNSVRIMSGQVDTFAAPTATASGSITVSDNGRSATYTVTSQTKVLLAGGQAGFADVRDGDRVSLKLDGTRATEITIRVETATVTATLEAVDFGSSSTLPTLKVKGANNVRTTYSVADQASIKAANGTAITLDDLNVGDQLTLKVERDLVTAIQVKSSASRTLNGQVDGFISPTRTANGEITVSENRTSTTYTVTSTTEVLLAGRKATFADVLDGDKVTLKLEGARVTQIAIKVETLTVMGTLDTLNLGSGSALATIKIKGSNNVKTTYTVGDNVTVKAANGTVIALGDLNTGDQLTVRVERNLVTLIQVRR